MANGNPADVGYNPQGVPEAVLQGLINRKSPKAAGLEGFLNSGFFPQLGQTIQQMGQNEQKKKKQDQLQQLLQAMRTQGAPQQGPQMPAGPPIQGPAGYTPPGAGSSAVPAGQAPMPQNPTSGMGAPAQDNSDRIKQLMMAYDPQGSMEAMQKQMFPAVMNPLQQSEIAKNQALTKRYSMPPQQKTPNPTDEALKQARIEAIQALLSRQGQPKPPKPIDPVAAARLQFEVDKANAGNQSRWPWQKAPVLKNPLQGQAQAPAEVQGLSDEELLAIAGQSGDQ